MVVEKSDQSPTAAAQLPKEEMGWRRIVRNFTPSWFAINMGTGIVSILIHGLPYNANWLQYFSYVWFGLNVVLFLIFLAITTLRYVLYPEIWSAMINHPTQSLFLGCFPMGLATIINMIVLVCGSWGIWTVYLAWALWWLDAALALATCVLMPLIVMHKHKPQLHQTSAALLLPIVPAVVAAATGGLVADYLPEPDHAVTTIVVSYILWGLGVTFSSLILAMYFHRLHIHQLPPKAVIVSVFLPIGPLGQGGFGIQQLGKVALKVLPQTSAFSTVGMDPLRGGEVLYIFGLVVAFIMWGCALGWLTFAVVTIIQMKDFPFNMGWWGFTFPLGVFTTCCGLFATDLDSTCFKVLTMIFSCCVFVLWILVSGRTIHLSLTGAMFYAPCLEDLRSKSAQPGTPAEAEQPDPQDSPIDTDEDMV